MDRPLDSGYRRRVLIKRLLLALGALVVIAAVLVWGPGWIRPSLSRGRIRTAKVETGPIEATITASGTILPEFEQVISSPIEARVLKILQRPGSLLTTGQPILQLDVSQSVLAVEKANQQLELKQNQMAKLKLDLESTLIGLRSQWEIKNLEYKSAKANSAKTRDLFSQGLVSQEVLRQAELQEEKTGIELQQLEDSQKNAQKSTSTQLDGLELELNTLRKERDEDQRQLDLATTKSDRDGVLTWVVPEEGATVHKGDVLARIADLTSFRVVATVSDIHAARLIPGMPVAVKINDEPLSGSIATIDPTIQNGAVTLTASLVDKSSPLLRSNLRVDVLIGMDHKDRVLAVKKGPALNSEGMHDVFVLRGDAAIKVPVRIGITSFDRVEVLQGLEEGDEVIISDMTDYMHLKEIRLK